MAHGTQTLGAVSNMFAGVGGYKAYANKFLLEGGGGLNINENEYPGKYVKLSTGEKASFTCSVTYCDDEFVSAYNSGGFRGRQPLPFSDKKKINMTEKVQHRHQNR
jgi:hypothetical protein